jgi:NAD-dependent deacetylase
VNISGELILLLRKAKYVVALTGAGVSQESGLRTFRDAHTGLWAEHRPEDLATPQAFARNPKMVWDWYAMRRKKLQNAQPNPAHFALVEMARHIPEFMLITQNVDGLHLKAGSPSVVELHGNIQRVKCSSCDRQAHSWNDSDENVPRCDYCGNLLRPDVVWYNESLPRDVLELAIEAARSCQVFFSIGTSGVVQPAASLAFGARNKGAVIIEINAESTPLTTRTDFAMHGKAGEILPALVREVWGTTVSEI